MKTKIDLKDIFQFTSNGVIATDHKGRITHINRRSETILNIDARKHVGQTLLDVLPLTGSAVQQCLANGAQILGHQVHGKRTKLVLNVTPVMRHGEVAGAICNFQELSIFEKSARNLDSYKKLNRQLEAIFNASSDGIWVCNGRGVVISVNKASEALNGIKAGDVVGQTVAALLGNKVFDRSVTEQVLKTSRQQTIMQHVGKTGRSLLSTGTPVFDDNGNIFLVVVNERDMTELNGLRRQIEQNQKIAEKYREELADLSFRELKRNEIIAESSKMRHIIQMALKLSRIDASNILILGESGTGKGLLAKLIHKNSTRHKNPFVEINCAALPENLLEAELFGYEKGAFTGASETGKIGLFELAQGGTLFLDEIGDMPLALQAKLLKYLDDKEIRRIGGTESITVECSTIAATNQDLSQLVKQKKFREDLFYRLNSFIIEIPPLRERQEDILALTRFYLNKYNHQYHCGKTIQSDAMQALQRYFFPGNIRELKNIIENAVVMSDDDRMGEFIRKSLKEIDVARGAGLLGEGYGSLCLRDRLAEVEKKMLRRALNRCRNTREMALELKISQPSVVRKLKKYRIK